MIAGRAGAGVSRVRQALASTGLDSDQTDAFMAAITALIHAHTVAIEAGIGDWKVLYR